MTITTRKAKKKQNVRLFVVLGCHKCPNVESRRTPGAGYAEDYWCTAVTPQQKVAGYVEWNSQKRKDQDFPDWCPLEKRGA